MLDRVSHPRVNIVLKVDASAVALPQGEHFVGRSASCFLCVDDPAVSRHHLRFVLDGQRALVEDLSSTNGTLINGRPLRGMHALADGDELKLGNRVLHVRFIDTVAAAGRERSTPPPERTQPTRRGGAAVTLSESCPRCRAPAPVGLTLCGGCGYRWPRGSRKARTAPENPALHLRRRAERIDVQLRVRYVSENLHLDAQAENISENGAFVSAGRLDPVGTHCALQFGEGDGGAVLHGFVRRVVHRGVKGQAGMGIEFDAMSDDAEGWLLGRLAEAAIRAVD